MARTLYLSPVLSECEAAGGLSYLGAGVQLARRIGEDILFGGCNLEQRLVPGMNRWCQQPKTYSSKKSKNEGLD